MTLALPFSCDAGDPLAPAPWTLMSRPGCAALCASLVTNTMSTAGSITRAATTTVAVGELDDGSAVADVGERRPLDPFRDTGGGDDEE